jgi:DNA-binding CsgD family transcriptional regulator
MFDPIGLGAGLPAPAGSELLVDALVPPTVQRQAPARRVGDGAPARPPAVLATAAATAAPSLSASAQLRWLAHMLDEVDNGMLLVNSEAQLLYMNHSARMELDGQHPLRLGDNTLRTHLAQDVARFFDALAACQQGLRLLVNLGEGAQRVTVSLVPQPMGLGQGADGQIQTAVLLVLGKRTLGNALAVERYARSLGLTPAETRVLQGLCNGQKPTQMASEFDVAICTLRSQIGALRHKAGARSIPELVRQVALLPPQVGVLRGSETGGQRRV